MELFNSKELEHLRWAINVILFGRCSAYRTRGRSICYNPLNYKARSNSRRHAERTKRANRPLLSCMVGAAHQ